MAATGGDEALEIKSLASVEAQANFLQVGQAGKWEGVEGASF